MYIATCYVRINGTVYVPGECIEEEIPEEKLRWLLETGAIYIPAPEPPADVEGLEEDECSEPVREDADGMGEDAEDSEGDDEEDAEASEEEEAPEIDVMAGIVAQPEKTSRKSAERRKK